MLNALFILLYYYIVIYYFIIWLWIIITIITPIFLLGYDLDVQWKDEEYHSGNILCGVVNGSAIKLLSQLPSISGSINNRQLINEIMVWIIVKYY